MAVRTFSSVAGRTVSGAFRLRETVPTETPEAEATSRMVTDLFVACRMSGPLSVNPKAEPHGGYHVGYARSRRYRQWLADGRKSYEISDETQHGRFSLLLWYPLITTDPEILAAERQAGGALGPARVP
jgi:hypothetical protein